MNRNDMIAKLREAATWYRDQQAMPDEAGPWQIETIADALEQERRELVRVRDEMRDAAADSGGGWAHAAAGKWADALSKVIGDAK